MHSKETLIISHVTDGDGYILSHSSLVGDLLRDNDHVYVVPVGEKDEIQGGDRDRTISDDINSMDLHPSRICAFWVKSQRVVAKKLALCSKSNFISEMHTTDVGVVLSELLHSGDPHVRHIIGVACENIVSSEDGCTFMMSHHSLLDRVISVLSDSNDLTFISCCLRVMKHIIDASSDELISEKLLSKGLVSIVASLPARCVKYWGGGAEEVAIVNTLCMEILVNIKGGKGHGSDDYSTSELDNEMKEMDPSSYSIYSETKENYYDKCSVVDLLSLVSAKDDDMRQYALKLLVQRAATQSFIDAIVAQNAFQTLNDAYSVIEDAGPTCSNDLLFIATIFHQSVLYAERDRVKLLLKYGGAPLMVRLALSKSEPCWEVMSDCFTLYEIFNIFNSNQLFALVHTPVKAIQRLVVREITNRVMNDDENNMGKYCHKIIRLLGHREDADIQLFASEAVAQLSLKETNKKEVLCIACIHMDMLFFSCPHLFYLTPVSLSRISIIVDQIWSRKVID